MITITLDDFEFKYPLAAPAKAYSQDSAGNNGGVLLLPPIRYTRSLRITYAYPATNRDVAAYALVLPD